MQKYNFDFIILCLKKKIEYLKIFIIWKSWYSQDFLFWKSWYYQVFRFQNLDIDYLHVFPYSNRSSTGSILLCNKVDNIEIKNRSRKLRDISRSKNQYFYKKNLDKEHNILFESFNDGYLSGLTENYIKVNVKGSCDLVNSIQPIIINKIENNNVFGKILIWNYIPLLALQVILVLVRQHLLK